MTSRWSWFSVSFGLLTMAKQLTGPAGRPRMCSYNRMKVNALSQHFSFGMSRGCAAEGVLLDRAACFGRNGNRDLARSVVPGLGVLCLASPLPSSSVTSASSDTDTQYITCSVAPLPTDRLGSSPCSKNDRARHLLRDRDACLTPAKPAEVLPWSISRARKRTHSGNGGSGGNGKDDVICDTLIRNDCESPEAPGTRPASAGVPGTILKISHAGLLVAKPSPASARELPRAVSPTSGTPRVGHASWLSSES